MNRHQNNKLGVLVSIEFEAIDPLSSQFSERMSSMSEMLTDAYTPVEMQFAKKFPEAVSQDKFLHSLPSFFKESEIRNILKQFFSENFTKSLSSNREVCLNYAHFLISAKDRNTKSLQGALYCMVNKAEHEKIVKVPIFGVSPDMQGCGIGKRLMHAIFEHIPWVKKIILSTRITNERALNAYHAWGFVDAPNTMKYWANLEYP